MKQFSLSTAISVLFLFTGTSLFAGGGEIYQLSPFEVSASDFLYRQNNELLSSTIDLGSIFNNRAVTLREKADFITLRLHLVNDARLSDLRLSEIRETVRMMLESAEKNGRVNLQYSRGEITADNFHVNPNDNSNDTSDFNVFLALPLGPDDSADKLTDELIAFAQALKVDGRTLIEVGRPGLSVKDPERFRGELLKDIAADIEQVRKAFGPDTRFVLSGVNRRMRVQAVSADEVELLLPYSFTIRSENFRND